MAFVFGLLLAVGWRSSMLHSGSEFLRAILKDRSGVGAAELLAVAVLGVLLFRFRDEDLLSPAELALVAVSSLAFALPLRLAAAVPLLLVGGALFFRRDPRVNSIGQLLLAVAFYEWIGPICFHLLSPLVLEIESFAVQMLLSPLGGFTRDNLMISNANGHGIFIEEGCSAFHNLSLATLIWISLVKLDSLELTPLHWRLFALMAAATVALNTIRIAMMAQSFEMYDYWHNGFGAQLVSFAMLAIILAIYLGGLTIAERR